MSAKRTVAIVITLDTKAAVAEFVRDEIQAWGLNTLLIDPGILGEPAVQADFTRYDVANAAGTTLPELRATKNKGLCIATQTQGVVNIVQQLYAQDKLDGILSCGGGQGTSIGTAAMRALPTGVPKVMLSTVASGLFQFGSYVGTKDLCMMHSVTDILDVNAISRPILQNAANAIAGMALRRAKEPAHDPPAIAIMQLGMTTPCVIRAKELLEAQGYQVIPFHASGTGGPAMEELAEEGRFAGIIDLSVHEIIDGLYDGLAGATGRLGELTRRAIPAVVSVCGNDYVLFENLAKAPERFRHRRSVTHNPQMTVFAPTVDEMLEAARAMIDPLNRALGPTLVVIPTRGFTHINQPGGELYLPEGNAAVIREFQASLKSEIPVVLVDAQVNNPVFADVLADCMARLLKGETPAQIATRHHNPAAQVPAGLRKLDAIA